MLSKDFNRIKNINRNNIVIENIRGKNVVLNGYFVFHINFVDSEPLLKIFHSPEDGSNLISAIPYTNESMGFNITLPERWKSKYQIIQFDNQVAFFHKEIFLKHGKGSGNLFRITKIAPPTENNLAEAGELCEYLYWGKHFAYVWSTPSDIQYPIWENSDEEDTLFANDYEDMMMDLNFIKNSFSLLDEPSLYTPADQVSETDKNKSHVPVSSAKEQKNEFIIKSSSVADEPYAGFEQLVLKNTGAEKIKRELDKQGIEETRNSTVDLTRHYVVKDYSAEQTKVESDENGNISMYFSVNSDSLFDVHFYDAETNKNVGNYNILANNENVYSFIGFEKDKFYTVVVQSETKDDWAIEGNYIIY